jgi:uncharacterized protein (TIGR03067 family)
VTDTSSADLAHLQGAWTQVHLEVDGIANPPDDYTSPGARLTIAGNAFVVRHASGEILLHGIFELNAATAPKSITWIDAVGADAGKRLPASYHLTPDSFTFIAADPGAPRPLVFRTIPGQTMRAFKRWPG